ncbi:MAG: fatty acid desaturase [Bryobacteraceae bacterium]|nr:fatty acid desaturase [Bryobacteraceae bacterium]
MSLLWICVISAVVCQISVFFTTIYLHRALTHGGLVLNRAMGTLMHLHIALFTGIKPREWVAVHRKHHHFSDKEGDPHSPLLYGLWHVFFGNAFYYGKEAGNPATVQKYTPDYKPDLIDKLPQGLVKFAIFGGLGIFMAMFGWLAGAIAFAVQGVVYVLLNSSINSICHMIGYRNFENQATNLQSIALVTGGEGLHNNHHEYPSSALFALRDGEIDPAWPVIVALEKLGLAKVNRAPIAKAA